MDLNEIIENNTLEQIGRRTRLTEENLEKLFSRDFKGFTKVQTLGFISILEREYRADLSDLRNDCMGYFDGVVKNNNPAQEHIVPHKSIQDTSNLIGGRNNYMGGRYFKPIIVAVAAVFVLYAAWKSYSVSMGSDNNISAQKHNGGFFSSIVNQTKTWMGPDTNGSQSDQHSGSVEQKGWADENSSTKDSFVITERPDEAEKDEKDMVDNTSKEENKIIKTVKQEQAEQNKQKEETTLDEIRQTDQAIAQISQESNSIEKSPLAPEVPSISKDTADQKPYEVTAVKNKKVITQTNTDNKAAAKEETWEKADEMARKKAEAKKNRAKEAARKKAEEAAAKKAAQEKALAAKAAKEKALKAKLAKEKAAKLKAAKEKARKAKLAKEKAAKLKAAKEKNAKKGKLVLVPSKNIWLGIVDLKTMKRRVSKSSSSVSFDDPKGRWIIATGHGHFTFKDGNRVIRFNDGKKHYLIVQKGVMHEIPHATFQKLNQSKVW